MSANNQLVIIKKGKFFELHENLCYDNDFKPDKYSLIKKDKDLYKIIKYARNYTINHIVEYGINYDF